jgi:hypothetical protein
MSSFCQSILVFQSQRDDVSQVVGKNHAEEEEEGRNKMAR